MKLDAVLADVHVFDGVAKTRAPVRLRLAFSDGTFIRLSGSGDGSRMILNRLPLEGPIDLEEYGRIQVCDITNEIEPSLVEGAIGWPMIIEAPDGRIVALALPRMDAPPFCFWTDCDEFAWGDETALATYAWHPEDRPKVSRPLEPTDIASH